MAANKSVIADVNARVWDSHSGTEFVLGRIIVDREQIVLFSGETRRQVSVNTIFDISTGYVPHNLDHTSGEILTLGFQERELRQLASIEADHDVINRLTSILFKLVLNDSEVIVRHPAWTDEQRQVTPPEVAKLSIDPDTLTLERTGSPITFETETLTKFERVATGPRGGLPITIGIYRSSGDSTVRTDITFTSQAKVNLFGRFLGIYSDASRETPSSINVLIVDDEPGLAETIGLLLQKESVHYLSKPMDGPLAAIDYLAENPGIDCIVSDYQMEGMNGIEFLKAVRQVRPNLPFILLTGNGSEEVAEAALRIGVTDYIRKSSIQDQTAEIASRIRRAVAETRPHIDRVGGT